MRLFKFLIIKTLTGVMLLGVVVLALANEYVIGELAPRWATVIETKRLN